MAFIPAAPEEDYVAMGDSYSSGEGLQPFDANSDYNYAGMKDACHRAGSYSSGQAYAQLVTLPGQPTSIVQQAASLTGGTQYQFLACSGDYTTEISQNAVGDPEMPNTPWGQLSLGYYELPQADTGYLRPNTTLVTLTVGGDDARFSSVVKACADQPNDCTASDFYMTDTATGQLDPEPLTTYEPQVIAALQQHLEDAYSAIAAAAPNAEIIVVGYPDLFPGDTSAPECQVAPGVTIPADATSWMNAMGDQLNQVTSTAVADIAQPGRQHSLHQPESRIQRS